MLPSEPHHVTLCFSISGPPTLILMGPSGLCSDTDIFDDGEQRFFSFIVCGLCRVIERFVPFNMSTKV